MQIKLTVTADSKLNVADVDKLFTDTENLKTIIL